MEFDKILHDRTDDGWIENNSFERKYDVYLPIIVNKRAHVIFIKIRKFSFCRTFLVIFCNLNIFHSNSARSFAITFTHTVYDWINRII